MIGYVYIFKSDLGYKIGFTTRTPEKRLNEFSKLPYKVELLYSLKVNDCRRIEKYLHKLFEDYKINGEWFDLNEDDIIKSKIFISKHSVENSVTFFT